MNVLHHCITLYLFVFTFFIHNAENNKLNPYNTRAQQNYEYSPAAAELEQLLQQQQRQITNRPTIPSTNPAPQFTTKQLQLSPLISLNDLANTAAQQPKIPLLTTPRIPVAIKNINPPERYTDHNPALNILNTSSFTSPLIPVSKPSPTSSAATILSNKNVQLPSSSTKNSSKKRSQIATNNTESTKEQHDDEEPNKKRRRTTKTASRNANSTCIINSSEKKRRRSTQNAEESSKKRKIESAQVHSTPHDLNIAPSCPPTNIPLSILTNNNKPEENATPQTNTESTVIQNNHAPSQTIISAQQINSGEIGTIHQQQHTNESEWEENIKKFADDKKCWLPSDAVKIICTTYPLSGCNTYEEYLDKLSKRLKDRENSFLIPMIQKNYISKKSPQDANKSKNFMDNWPSQFDYFILPQYTFDWNKELKIKKDMYWCIFNLTEDKGEKNREQLLKQAFEYNFNLINILRYFLYAPSHQLSTNHMKFLLKKATDYCQRPMRADEKTHTQTLYRDMLYYGLRKSIKKMNTALSMLILEQKFNLHHSNILDSTPNRQNVVSPEIIDQGYLLFKLCWYIQEQKFEYKKWNAFKLIAQQLLESGANIAQSISLDDSFYIQWERKNPTWAQRFIQWQQECSHLDCSVNTVIEVKNCWKIQYPQNQRYFNELDSIFEKYPAPHKK